MKTEKAFYVGTNHNSYRVGEPAEILSVVTCIPTDLFPRTCFWIRYADGKEDYCPTSDTFNYKLLIPDQVCIIYKMKD